VKLRFATNADTRTGLAYAAKTEISGFSLVLDLSLNSRYPNDLLKVRAMRDICIALQARRIGFDA